MSSEALPVLDRTVRHMSPPQQMALIARVVKLRIMPGRAALAV
jgi:hypothetical protein